MSAGSTARLFVAVAPPAAVRDALARWARDAAAALAGHDRGRPRHAPRLLDAGSLHLTLCFLGARPLEEIEALAGAIEACASAVAELSLGAPVWLPPRRPRALAVEVRDETGELARLHGALAGALSSVSGWQPERRRFRAHITVARVREGAVTTRAADERALELPATPSLGFTPASIVLYSSRLAPTGATYEALASASLQPPGA